VHAESNNPQPHTIRSAKELEEYLSERGVSWKIAKLPKKELFEKGFPIRIPHYYADLINWRDLVDPLRLMVIPDEREQQPRSYELSDPIGDHAHEAIPGLIHRYPDRCLLLLTSYCLVHCRFCFRREVVGKVRPVQFLNIENYLTEHKEVREIIFSGGDPFTFPVGFLQSMIVHFAKLDHIRVWRFHTRIPAIDPNSVSDEWIEELSKISDKFEKQIVVVVHINHPREITNDFHKLVRKLKTAGCLILSQSVLLKNVNDSSDTLMELFRKLIFCGVKPYYLHHLDQVLGSHHFRISIEKGKHLFTSLRGNLSSICLPEYVIDLPGGFGKIPVKWLEKIDNKIYRITNFEGKTIEYVDQSDDE
jgi:lysine 2,3-aminomutase